VGDGVGAQRRGERCDTVERAPPHHRAIEATTTELGGGGMTCGDAMRMPPVIPCTVSMAETVEADTPSGDGPLGHDSRKRVRRPNPRVIKAEWVGVREYGGDISIVMNETDHRTNNYSVTEIILPLLLSLFYPTLCSSSSPIP
jgi:hypothetical protein